MRLKFLPLCIASRPVKRPSFWQSLRHAWDGCIFVWRTQRNARIHYLMAAIVAGMAVWLQVDFVSCAVLALAVGAVIAGEFFNTAVEAVVDLLSPQYHERAKVAKDVAAGAVLMLGVMSIVVGLLLLGPPLWQRVFDETFS
jgi:diacylglycerol kinase